MICPLTINLIGQLYQFNNLALVADHEVNLFCSWIGLIIV